MLKRRIAVLCMLLVLGLGATSAYADTSVQPSAELLALTDATNQALDLAIQAALGAAELVTKAYESGVITYQQADDAYAKIIDVLKDIEEFLIDNLKDAAKEEGVTVGCTYVTVQIGWRTTLIDPVIVPGNSD